MSDLPKDWEAVNSKDGFYYWHTVTGEVTWKKPKEPAKPTPPPPPPLPNSPINPEPQNDPYNYTDDYTQSAYPHFQPVQTCYQNVVLQDTDDNTGDDIPPPIPARGIDNYENVDLLEKPSNGSPNTPTIDRYKGPSEVQYACVQRVPDRKSNFRHSAVKRKLSDNAEELVITREKIDSEGPDEVPDVPERSPSLYVEEEMIAGVATPLEDRDSQFSLPFSNQYQEVDRPLLINDPHSSLTNLPSDKDKDPLLIADGRERRSATESDVNNQSRDSGIGLSSSTPANSFQSRAPVKPTSTVRVTSTLYENVELPFEKDEFTNPRGKLPDGWKEVDAEDGMYYWHIESGITQWDFPNKQPLSPEPIIQSDKPVSVSSQPPTPSVHSPLSDTSQDQSNVRIFSAWLLEQKDINASELKHGNCTNIIEKCIQSVCDRPQDEVIEQEVMLQVLPGVLKEINAKTNATNKVYSITRIRAWGCSRENSRYFAFIIRHSKSQAYKCYVYKCKTSAKSLTLALKEFSNRSESDSSSQSSPNNNNRQSIVGENELSTQQIEEGEQYQRFKVTYMGCIKVTDDTGIELVCSSLEKLKNQPANWVEASIDIFNTHFRVIEIKTGEVVMETRVRFLSFLGLSNDDSTCGYITGDDGTYYCIGFKVEPNAIQLSLAMKSACENRFKRVSKSIPDDSIRSNYSLRKLTDSNFINKAEVAGEKLGGYFKSKMNKVSKQMGNKLQRTSSARTIFGTYQVQLYGNAQVPIGDDKRAVEEAIAYLESQSSRLTDPYIIEFQITQGAFILLDKEKRKFTKKVFSISNVRYCLKKGHTVAFVVQNKTGLFDAYAIGEINTSASMIIETIQKAVNENI